MGFNPARHFDHVRRVRRQNEEVRQLRKRPHGHAEAKTHQIPGAIDTGTVPLVCFFAVDPDNTIPEVKLLFEVRAMLGAGTASIKWQHNGTDVTGSTQTVDTDPLTDPVTFDPPISIAHGDYFKPVVVSASSAFDLQAVLFVVTRQA